MLYEQANCAILPTPVYVTTNPTVCIYLYNIQIIFIFNLYLKMRFVSISMNWVSFGNQNIALWATNNVSQIYWSF